MSERDFFETGSLKRAIDRMAQNAQKRGRKPTREEADELEAMRRSVNQVIYGRVRGRWNAEGLRQSDWLSEYLAPTGPDLERMVAKIYHRLGSIRATAILLGTDRHSVKDWIYGKRPIKDKPQIRRLIWLTWALLCVPWRLQSAFDVLTWGRFAVRAGDDGRESLTDPDETGEG